MEPYKTASYQNKDNPILNSEEFLIIRTVTSLIHVVQKARNKVENGNILYREEVQFNENK